MFDASGTTVVNSTFGIFEEPTLNALLIGNQAVAEMANEVVYSRHQNTPTGVKQSHSNILYTNAITGSGNANLLIDVANNTSFDFNTEDRIYGIQIYIIGSEKTTNDVDYRMYSGAVKNIAGTVSIVGTGFTEITLAQDSEIWVSTPTFTVSGGITLTINIVNNKANQIAVAARVEIISDGLL